MSVHVTCLYLYIVPPIYTYMLCPYAPYFLNHAYASPHMASTVIHIRHPDSPEASTYLEEKQWLVTYYYKNPRPRSRTPDPSKSCPVLLEVCAQEHSPRIPRITLVRLIDRRFARKPLDQKTLLQPTSTNRVAVNIHHSSVRPHKL